MAPRSDRKGSIFGDWARLLEYLPHHDEREELVILKGHLLVEERLRSYISSRLPNASGFDRGNFSFSKCVVIADALTAPSRHSWVFEGAAKLNALRNEIAHKLDSNGYSKRKGEFLSCTERHEKDPTVPPSERGDTRLYVAVTHLFHSLGDLMRSGEEPEVSSGARGEETK